jgi:hypothetical protein
LAIIFRRYGLEESVAYFSAEKKTTGAPVKNEEKLISLNRNEEKA